jgi:hypothetical protein
VPPGRQNSLDGSQGSVVPLGVIVVDPGPIQNILVGDDVSGAVASASRGVIAVVPNPVVKEPLPDDDPDLFTQVHQYYCINDFGVEPMIKGNNGKKKNNLQITSLPGNMNLMSKCNSSIIICQLACLRGRVRCQRYPIVYVKNTSVATRGPYRGYARNLVFFCVGITGKPCWTRDCGARRCLRGFISNVNEEWEVKKE